jgi:hypothetical protein
MSSFARIIISSGTLNIAGAVNGSVLYFNGVNWVALLPSTDGQVLTTHNIGAAPSWEDVDLNIPGALIGSILYYDGFDWTQLPPGEDGYILTTHDIGNAPSWEDPATGNNRNHKIVNTTPYNLKVNDDILLVDTRVNPITINLGPVASNDEHHILIKDYYGNAKTNNITLQADVGEKVEGGNTYLVNHNYTAIWVAGEIANGWFIR